MIKKYNFRQIILLITLTIKIDIMVKKIILMKKISDLERASKNRSFSLAKDSLTSILKPDYISKFKIIFIIIFLNFKYSY